MRCENCGGKLTVKDGLFYCESCKSKFDLSLGFEKNDVFIAYIENDEYGHRSKDSVIGQEIYSKLENAKIRTYYQRISVEEFFGDTVELLSATAFDLAKVVIFLGTSNHHFTELLEKYRDKLTDKIILPVYVNMDAHELPSELKSLQALNYNSVGAISDLTKSVLKIIGRENEINVINEGERIRKKKKRTILISILCVCLIALATAAYIVFGTTFVLSSKKYDYAQKLIENEKYAEAIVILNKIYDYKNSKILLSETYNKYAGYYQRDDGTIGLHIIISDNRNANIEITETSSTFGIVKISENAEITTDTIKIYFNDSENNQGTAFIEFTNQGINLSVETDNKNAWKTFFDISDKSDQLILGEIDASTIKSWLKSKTTEQNIKSLGYELVFEHALYKDTASSQYNIRNTEIKVALFDYDISKTDGTIGSNAPIFDSKTAFAFTVPAKNLIPEKIGQSTLPYIEDDILYIPNSETDQAYHQLDFYISDTESTDIITGDMQISCTSKALLSKEHWDVLVEKYVYEPRIKINAISEYGNSIETVFGIKAEAESDTHYLFSIRLKNSNISLLYRINKFDFAVEYITNAYFDESERKVNWQINSDLADEFTNDFDLR